MGRIVVTEFVTVDGVFEDPGGSEGTSFGGWQLAGQDMDVMQYKMDELNNADAHLLGRKTYDGFAAAWPTIQGTGEFGELMNSLPKHVVTSSDDKLEWNNSSRLQGDLKTGIEQLKQKYERDILVAGSGQLVRALLELKLVDELRLMVHPLVLGQGRQLFDGASQTELKLVGSKEFPSGRVILTYTLA